LEKAVYNKGGVGPITVRKGECLWIIVSCTS
jgi:hypothetical protein